MRNFLSLIMLITGIFQNILVTANDSVLTLKKFSVDKDQFLYTVLSEFDPAQKYPCGLSGSVDERIKDCSVQETLSKGNFVLVSRSKEFKEVHKDTKSGLLWSDRFEWDMNHYEAEKACNLKKLTGVPGSWRLPSIDEYKTARTNGIKYALPNMNYWFWSSSVHIGKNDAWLFNGNSSYVDFYYRGSNYTSVRCVAN